MNQTNTDYLLQTIPTGVDRAPNPARNGNRSGFGDHLSHASTSVFDVLRPAIADMSSRSSTSVSEKTHSRRDTESADPSRQPTDTADACNAAPSPCDAEDRHSDDDTATDNESTDATSALAAASSDIVDSVTAKHSEGSEPTAANEEVASDETAELATRNHANIEDASGKSNSQSANIEAISDAVTNLTETVAAADNVVGVGSDAATDKDTHAKESQHADRKTATKAGSAEESANGENAARTSNQVTHNAAAAIAENALTAPDRAQAVTNATTTTIAAEANDSADSPNNDSRHDAKNSARANRGNDAVSPANKADAPAAVGALANIAGAADNGAATQEKSKAATKTAIAKTETSVGPLGSAMRAAAELARGGKSAGGDDTPQVDPARFVGRVAKAFHTAQQRGGTLQLRLSPPELGSLKLQLTVNDGVLSAALETENANARRVLLDHLPALRDRLAGQNIRVERFDVDVQQEYNRGQSNPRGSNQNPYQQQPDQSEPRRPTATQPKARDATPTASPAVVARVNANGINLVV